LRDHDHAASKTNAVSLLYAPVHVVRAGLFRNCAWRALRQRHAPIRCYAVSIVSKISPDARRPRDRMAAIKHRATINISTPLLRWQGHWQQDRCL